MAERARSIGARVTVLLSCLAITVSIASCSIAPATPEANGDIAAVVSDGLDRYHEQHLAWGPCAPFATQDEHEAFADPKFDCARLEVPLDYATPAGRTAQIAVMRQRTTRPNRIGSLVLNPGGPGDSGLALVPQMSGPLGGGSFDLVGFDPRGVGQSTPAIVCLTPKERDADRADDDFDTSPAGVARAEAKAQLQAQHCVERSGGVEVIANVGTRDVARDLDVLRAALGDQRLTYLGFSYGTRIGTTYAELFPSNVRALVLDGAMDPEATPDQGNDLSALQAAFQVYADHCAQNPACPLGRDPARATTSFQALSRALIGRPVSVYGDTRRLSYNDVIAAVFDASDDSDSWPTLTEGLAELKNGDGTTLMQLADEYYERRPDGTYPNSMDVNPVVYCLDGGRVTDPAEISDLSRQEAETAPFEDAGFGPSSARDACAFLPVPTTGAAHKPDVPGLPPVLVVSSTGDPFTAYQAGVYLANDLHGALLTVDSDQHTASERGNPCVDNIVADYLVKLRVPEPGTRCKPKP